MKLTHFLRLGTRALGSLAASATLVLMLSAPSQAQGCSPSGDGGWVNLPGGNGNGRNLGEDRGIGIVLVGQSVRDLTGRPMTANAKFIVDGAIGMLAGAFNVGLNLDNFARGDYAAIRVGANYAGGFAVIHARGLPLVAFATNTELTTLPVEALVALAGMGQTDLQITFVAPLLDHVTTLDLSIGLPGPGQNGALMLRADLR